MRVGPEACARCNTVFIDDAQRTERFVFVVLVPSKRCRSGIRRQMNVREGTYIANEKVWNVFSQSWSALPRSSLQRGTNFMAAGIVFVEKGEDFKEETALDVVALRC